MKYLTSEIKRFRKRLRSLQFASISPRASLKDLGSPTADCDTRSVRKGTQSTRLSSCNHGRCLGASSDYDSVEYLRVENVNDRKDLRYSRLKSSMHIELKLSSWHCKKNTNTDKNFTCNQNCKDVLLNVIHPFGGTEALTRAS